jgi:hypothetical protein
MESRSDHLAADVSSAEPKPKFFEAEFMLQFAPKC